MRFVIQRVSQASVTMTETSVVQSIGTGLLVYVGIHKDDAEQDWHEKVNKFVRRVDKLQVFTSSSGESKSVGLRDIGGELLVISNFTLYGRNKKAGSVDFMHAAKADIAKPIYDYLIQEVENKGISLKTGVFGAQMEVSSVVDGPLNLVLEW